MHCKILDQIDRPQGQAIVAVIERGFLFRLMGDLGPLMQQPYYIFVCKNSTTKDILNKYHLKANNILRLLVPMSTLRDIGRI